MHDFFHPRPDPGGKMDKPEKTDQSDRSKAEPTPKPRKPVNPPRTTTGKWASPKFGSAGSGGAELEPGPEDD